MRTEDATGDAATRARIAELVGQASEGAEPAREELAGLIAEHSEGAVGDHAALGLGAALLRAGESHAALPLLSRAAKGGVAPLYARLLLADAVAELPGTGAFDEARQLLRGVLGQADTAALAREGRWRLLELQTAAEEWKEAVATGTLLLGEPLPPHLLDEVRWLTAEAHRRTGGTVEAIELYRAIWHRSPGGPYGERARDRLAAAGVATEPPTPEERLLWVERLQRGGMHEHALNALGPMLVGQVDAEVRARASYLAVRSHMARRENLEAVERAHALRRASPRSPWAGKAGVEAMRALGRQGRTRRLRAWEEWLRTTHPRSEMADEARYYLGSYLSGAGFADAGLRVLREVAAGSSARAPYALWKVAWTERGRGRIADARAALEKLESAAAGSGFRVAARYWLARFAEEPDGPSARERLRLVVLESPRGYYGQLAGDRLGDAGDEGLASPPRSTFPGIDLLRDPSRRPEPAYRRAVELRLLGLHGFAVGELETLARGGDAPLRVGLAYLRVRAGTPWMALDDLADFEGALQPEPLFSPNVPLPVWRAAYPLPFRQQLAEIAGQPWVVPPLDGWLVAAVARRESRFWPRAVSPAGAVGLLQLTPRTAAETAKRLGEPDPGREGLFDPATNLELGAAKLASLLSAFDGAVAPALAAYNAGETVTRGWWVSRPKGQDVEEWVETIPYAETRLYVKAVLADWRSYRELYGRLR